MRTSDKMNKINEIADTSADEIFTGRIRKAFQKDSCHNNGKASSPPGSGKKTGFGKQTGSGKQTGFPKTPGSGKQTGFPKQQHHNHVKVKKTVPPPSPLATILYGIIGMFSLMILCIVGVCLDMGLQIGMMIIVYFICNYMYGRGYFPFLYRKPMNQIPCTGCRVKKCGFKHYTD